MTSLIDIRRRIRSVKNMRQITKAMKMVSAAKLRRAQDRVLASRPYAILLRQMLGNVAGAVAAGADDVSAIHPLLASRAEQRIQVVLITGEKGLCGAFNSNVLKASLRFAEQHAGPSITYEVVGRKGRDFHRKRRAQISG